MNNSHLYDEKTFSHFNSSFFVPSEHPYITSLTLQDHDDRVRGKLLGNVLVVLSPSLA